jgi:DNA replication and repair protein RecF
VLVTGSNGVGKTNLLEALHVGTQGFSPRTRTDAQLIRFGCAAGRVALSGEAAGARLDLDVVLRAREGKRATLNGARLNAAEQLRSRVTALVFTPDRLAVVKGGPAVRRAYFDRVLGRLLPAQGKTPMEYAAAVAQRNAALRRAELGLAARDAVAPWTQQVAALGARLIADRVETLRLLGDPFGNRAAELGLDDVVLAYTGEPPTVEKLETRLERDLQRRATTLGPHLDDISISAGSRDLRSFGSQGEQRLAVLALLLAEAELLAARDTPPLLLLDDVLSELDSARRRALSGWAAEWGQTLITATSASVLPAEPAQLLLVSPGRVEVQT